MLLKQAAHRISHSCEVHYQASTVLVHLLFRKLKLLVYSCSDTLRDDLVAWIYAPLLHPQRR